MHIWVTQHMIFWKICRRNSYNSICLLYLNKWVETSLSKHILKEGVVLRAVDMRLQLGWQGRQQLIQTCRRKEEAGGQCGSGRCELLHAQQKTQVLYVCMNTYTPNTPRVRQKADAHVKTKHTKSCTSAFREEYILTQTTALIIICGCSSFSLHADSITH